MTEALDMFVIYHGASNEPDPFVGRRWSVNGKGCAPGPIVARGETLDQVRGQLPPGLFRLARSLGDDPVIVETWL